jgi:hypothetical protein
MRIVYHPEFPRDIRRFAAQYAEVSPRLEERFRLEVDRSLAVIIADPGTGHFVNTGSQIVHDVRRVNLHVFPFFVLYGVHSDRLIFGSLIPNATDPLTWLTRFGGHE